VNNFIADLEMIKTVQTAPVRGTQGVPLRWIPPPRGLVKINVDAAVSKNSSKAVAAAIARDVVGNFLGASALVIRGLSDPETVEAIACKEGLALASDLMVQHFRLASDNVNVIRGIKEDGMAVHGHIIREIKARALLILFMRTGAPMWMLIPSQGVRFMLSLVG